MTKLESNEFENEIKEIIEKRKTVFRLADKSNCIGHGLLITKIE